MTAQPGQDAGALAQQRVARKYRLLGYDVQENPQADVLPEFMRGANPDIVAQSKSDNVVIEVKRRSSLKGSNDLVGIAERVSNRPGWRFELVILDEEDRTWSADPATDYDSLLQKVQAATRARLPDMAYAYLTYILSAAARDLARKYKVKPEDKTDRSLFTDLGFKGILPETLTQECLSVLSIRDSLVHTPSGGGPSEADLKRLLHLCGQLREFL